MFAVVFLLFLPYCSLIMSSIEYSVLGVRFPGCMFPVWPRRLSPWARFPMCLPIFIILALLYLLVIMFVGMLCICVGGFGTMYLIRLSRVWIVHFSVRQVVSLFHTIIFCLGGCDSSFWIRLLLSAPAFWPYFSSCKSSIAFPCCSCSSFSALSLFP